MQLESETAFDRQCEALNALGVADIPDRTKPFAVVHSERPVAWFASFPDAGAYARSRFKPETYAIGDPSAGPDFLPMFFMHKPIA